ncbi:MAG: dockerin type I repeat-containing protein, partial [Candidatus Binatia bacterium]
TNASRYIRMFQSRRSLLMWKLYGQRLDGWSNADHPTESSPGDEDTLPPGADVNAADLDFIGQMMPPPGSGVPPLSEDEKMTFARWIDLGAPINWGGNGSTAYGWFLDDLRPSLDVSLPRPGVNPGPLGLIRLGAADAHTGVDWSTLSITADVPLAGRAAGAQLADLAGQNGDGIYTLSLTPPLAALADATVHVAVADHQGNITRVARHFAVVAGGPMPTATIAGPSPTATRTSTATASRTSTATASPSATPGPRAAVGGSVRYFSSDRPVAGVNLPGATTDAAGAYALTAALGADLTLSPRRSGGLGTAVSALDAARVLQHVAGLRQLDAIEALACDATGNGAVSTVDATRILQLVVGMRTRLPSAVLCDSDWAFVPDAAGPPPALVTPSFAGGICRPGAIVHTPLSGPASGQNFRAAVLGDCTGNWQPPVAAALRARASSSTASAGRLRRTRGGQYRLPIRISAASLSAVELELQADPSLRLRAVRALGPAQHSIVQFAQHPGGRVAVALASPAPLAGARLVAVFDGPADAAPAVRLRARVDDGEAPTR